MKTIETFTKERVARLRVAVPWFDRGFKYDSDFDRVVLLRVPRLINVDQVDSAISSRLVPFLRSVKSRDFEQFYLYRSRFGHFYGSLRHYWYKRGEGLRSSIIMLAPSVFYMAADAVPAVPGEWLPWYNGEPLNGFRSICNVYSGVFSGRRSRFYNDEEIDGEKVLTLRDIPL